MGHPVGNADPRGSAEWSLPLYVPTPQSLRRPLLNVSPYRSQEQDHSPLVNRIHGVSLACGNGSHCGRAGYKASLHGTKHQQLHKQLNYSHAALEMTEASEYGGSSILVILSLSRLRWDQEFETHLNSMQSHMGDRKNNWTQKKKSQNVSQPKERVWQTFV